MSKKQEKKHKRKSIEQTNENNPLWKKSKYDGAFRDFCQHQKSKLHNAKNTIRCLTEKLRICQKNEAEKGDIFSELNQSIEKNKEELAKLIEAQNTLTVENKAMKTRLIENDRKYTDLEMKYDQNVALLNSEISKLKQEVRTHTDSNAKLTTEFASSYNEVKAELLQKTEKVTELSEKIKELQQDLEHDKETITKLNEESVAALTSKLELEAIRTENKLKDEQLITIQNEKFEVEAAKNNEIQELSAKLAAVNRILGQQQHIKQVQPLSSVPSNSRENSHYITPNVPNSNVTTIGASSSHSNRRQSTLVIANDGPTVSQVSSQLIRNHSNTVDAEHNNSSDSDSEISIFRAGSSFAHSYLVPAARPQGFGRIKRSYERNIVIPESSESERNFSKIKRSK